MTMFDPLLAQYMGLPEEDFMIPGLRPPRWQVQPLGSGPPPPRPSPGGSRLIDQLKSLDYSPSGLGGPWTSPIDLTPVVNRQGLDPLAQFRQRGELPPETQPGPLPGLPTPTYSSPTQDPVLEQYEKGLRGRSLEDDEGVPPLLLEKPSPTQVERPKEKELPPEYFLNPETPAIGPEIPSQAKEKTPRDVLSLESMLGLPAERTPSARPGEAREGGAQGRILDMMEKIIRGEDTAPGGKGGGGGGGGIRLSPLQYNMPSAEVPQRDAPVDFDFSKMREMLEKAKPEEKGIDKERIMIAGLLAALGGFNPRPGEKLGHLMGRMAGAGGAGALQQYGKEQDAEERRKEQLSRYYLESAKAEGEFEKARVSRADRASDVRYDNLKSKYDDYFKREDTRLEWAYRSQQLQLLGIKASAAQTAAQAQMIAARERSRSGQLLALAKAYGVLSGGSGAREQGDDILLGRLARDISTNNMSLPSNVLPLGQIYSKLSQQLEAEMKAGNISAQEKMQMKDKDSPYFKSRYSAAIYDYLLEMADQNPERFRQLTDHLRKTYRSRDMLRAPRGGVADDLSLSIQGLGGDLF